MQEVVSFLNNNSPFYLATMDGDTPKVRPFGAVVEHGGKLFFCTSNQKALYQQLQVNHYFEVSTTSPQFEWIRLQGKARFIDNAEVKARFFEQLPQLVSIYGSPDNPKLAVFYVEDGKAEFCSFTSPPRTVIL